MDLLKFGMEHEQSTSKLLRTAAKGALAAERKKADLYEAYLEKKIVLPNEAEQDTALWENIKNAVARQEGRADDLENPADSVDLEDSADSTDSIASAGSSD